MKTFRKSRCGFTLVEMLIVVGILGVLLGLLSPAMLKQTRVSQEKRSANERKILEAAILEFWHDQKRWPINPSTKPSKDGSYFDNVKKSDAGNAYKIIYQDLNNVVFDQLINAPFGSGQTHKDYIDTKGHNTTPKAEDKYPVKAAAPLYDVLEGKNGAVKRNNPVLVYWTYRIRCPECPSSANNLGYIAGFAPLDKDHCESDECDYYKNSANNGERYIFTKADKKNVVRVVLPFKVTIDMLNNQVKVE